MFSISKEIMRSSYDRKAKMKAVDKLKNQNKKQKKLEKQVAKELTKMKQPKKSIPKKNILSIDLPDTEETKFQSVYFDELITDFDDIDIYNPKHQSYNDLYIPNDDIANDTRENIDAFNHLALPDTFKNDLSLLEMKQSNKAKYPQRQKVYYDKLVSGYYHTPSSKSDKNIATGIKVFYNNFPSFKKYKDTNDLQYIIDNHRLLFLELLQYIKNKQLSLATFKSYINAILRVLYLAFNKKYPIYTKYWALLQSLSKTIDKKEGDNMLTDLESSKFLPYYFILQERENLLQQWKNTKNRNNKSAYQLNQDLLLVGFYTYIPPLRNEPKVLKFSNEKKDKGDIVWFRTDKTYLILNEVKKRHNRIEIDLPKEFQELLEESYSLYPREPVFTNVSEYPKLTKQASVSTISNRLSKIFSKYNKSVGASSIRSSYVQYFIQGKISLTGNMPTYNELKTLSEQMRTSVKILLLSYNKNLSIIYPVADDDDVSNAVEAVPVDSVPAQAVNTVPAQAKTDKDNKTSTAYQRKLERMREYYQNNKEKMNQTTNKNRSTDEAKFKRQKREALKKLNEIAGYDEKVKQSTLTKYNIKKNADGIWE